MLMVVAASVQGSGAASPITSITFALPAWKCGSAVPGSRAATSPALAPIAVPISVVLPPAILFTVMPTSENRRDAAMSSWLPTRARYLTEPGFALA